MNIPILYQDPDLIIVNKPAGLPTHPDTEGEVSFDVVSLLKRQLGLDYLGIHQRLDREVSGVLAFSARREANAGLARAFEGREARKEYRAIVTGRLPNRTGSINQPLIEGLEGRWRVTRPGEPGGKPAQTSYRVEQTGPNNSYALLRLKLETGRTHQLRVHLAHLGCPILGDPWYAAPVVALAKAKTPPRPPVPASTSDGQFPRLLLHAYKLALLHPTTGKPLEVEAPAPAIFERAAQGQALPEIALALRLAETGLARLQTTDRQGLAGLLALADERRSPFSADPAQLTTAYRLINGAGDGLPGITLDRFGAALVLNCYDPLLEADQPGFKLLLEEIARQWSDASVYAKFRPRQLSNLASQGAKKAEITPELPLTGPTLPEIEVRENGLNYLIRPGEGFSPGLFLDMRETRQRLGEWSAGKTVLNCFGYTGAFGLVASANGASRALNLDAARLALEWGKQNYQLNNLTPDDFDFVEGDVFDWLARFARREQKFDIVILDPPSFSTVKKKRWVAEKDYGELAELAVRTVAPGGLLLACTNHAGLSRKDFRRMVLQGLEHADRPIQVRGYFHEPELDFPRSANLEGYLKILAIELGGANRKSKV